MNEIWTQRFLLPPPPPPTPRVQKDWLITGRHQQSSTGLMGYPFTEINESNNNQYIFV